MCIGVPMRVVSDGGLRVWCEGGGERAELDMLLIGPQPVGTWVLAFQGSARRVMNEEEALQTTAALEALAAAVNGETNLGHFFPDLVGEPQLPEHLRSKSMTTVATRLHPLFERLVREFGYGAPTLETFDSLVARAGHTLLFFADDPERSKETLDLAVILPEIARAFYGRFDVVVLLPAVANAVAPRYGIRRWPALILLRDGKYVGSIEAIRDWDDYQSEVTRLLKREPSAPPQPIAARAEATTARDHH